jgi:hypothetical protein
VPQNQLAMTASVFNEQSICIVTTGDDSGQITAGKGRQHGGFVMGRHSADGVHGNTQPLQHRGIRVVTGHRKHCIGGQ